MLNRWWQSWRASRDERTLRRRAIPDPLWQLTLARYPFIAQRPEADLLELRKLATLFLAQKEFTGGHGFEVSDEIAVAVAAQACLPVLRLGLDAYAGFVGIVMHSDEVVARREIVDEAGVVHHYDETLSGEAMDGGPVMLSWPDVEAAGESAEWGYNVVIHEFAHVLDLSDGLADGVPPLPDRAAREAWLQVIEAEYAEFCAEVDAGVDTLLDPYGAEAIDEFFAVASELFFVASADMLAEHPRLYRLLSGYYQQDPAAQ
ncbi:MAG TPA: M90 family metallopeptidase [Albitalea sp.]|nr:M90 family metallopeptidase [Albitalea sp.]